MKNINIIFLDIDGVLNSSITKEKFIGYIGIDNKNISALKKQKLISF